MKKLFISQPMKGKSDDEILREREKAIQKAKEVCGEEVEVIDSFFQAAPADAKPLWFLGKSLELLSTADIAYLQQDGMKHVAVKSNMSVQCNMKLM